MKAGTGHGSLYRLKNRRGEELPTWWIKFYVPGRKKPIRESAETSDEQEARRLLHKRLGEEAPVRVERLARREVTVAKLLDLVRDDYADQGRTLPPGILEAWLAALGPARAVDVQRKDLDAIARRWRTTGPEWPGRDRDRVRPLDRSTINRYMAILRRAYRLGREKLELEKALTFPRYKETNVGRAIPAPILKAVLASKTLTERWPARGAFFRFAYLGGVRRGQLLATRLAQFQPETGTMTWRPEQTKTEDAHNVTYTGEALELLRWFWERRDLSRPAFFQEDGSALTTDKLNAAWWAACREVGLPLGRKHGGYVIHELRHTMVSEWIHAGEPEKAIMSLTGHKAVATLHRYGHTSAEAQRASQERVATWRARQPAVAPKVVRLEEAAGRGGR